MSKVLTVVLALALAAAPSDSWMTLAPAPADFGHGASMAYPGTGDFLYALSGKKTQEFLRYSVSADAWTQMAPAPNSVESGSALAGTGGDFLYALRANDTATFWRYSISSNAWTTLASAPAVANHGASLAYPGSGDFLYALRGRGTTAFWRYSISGNSWSALEPAPGSIYKAGSLAWPGAGGFLYAIRGHDKTDFYRYSIADGTWSVLADLPEGPHNAEGALAAAGDPGRLYCFRGNQDTAFWRYSIADDAWSSAASTPAGFFKGAVLCGGPSTGRFLYATRGHHSGTFYRYEGVDLAPPAVTVNQAVGQPDPTAASPLHFTVSFSESVTGFDAGDVALTGTAGATTAQVTGGPATYDVAVSGMTGDGTVTVAIPAGAATDGAHGSLASTSGDDTVLFNLTSPSVTVNQAEDQADPTAATPIRFTIAFSEDVTGFDASDVTLTGGAGASTVVLTGGPAEFTAEVGGLSGDGAVIVSIGAGVCTDDVGNPNFALSSADNEVTFDATPPTVVVTADGADPTSQSPIVFTVEFSEPVSGFDPGDATIGGTAGPTTVVLTGGPTTFTVEVSGMTSDGVVTLGIPANAAADLAGNLNQPSTTADATVTYDTTPPTPEIHVDGTTITVVFTEPVTGLDTTDVVVTGGTPGPVTGGGTTYTVEITDPVGTPTVIVREGAATDTAGNPSVEASTEPLQGFESRSPRKVAGFCAASAAPGASPFWGAGLLLLVLAAYFFRGRAGLTFNRPVIARTSSAAR